MDKSVKDKHMPEMSVRVPEPLKPLLQLKHAGLFLLFRQYVFPLFIYFFLQKCFLHFYVWLIMPIKMFAFDNGDSGQYCLG